MDDIIRISCPKCGSVLKVKNIPGLEKKIITCPVCKSTHLFSQYKRMVTEQEDCTIYPGFEKGNHESKKESTDDDLQAMMGRLCVVNEYSIFPLKWGKNIVGRKASTSMATIQIPCKEKGMSREHLIIEVVKEDSVTHYVSLYKENINQTYIGNTLIEPGDKIVLKHGDVIKLPTVELRFELPDNGK